MSKDTELRPCPFCGGVPEIIIRSFGDSKDPQGNGSQIEISFHCCMGEAFTDRRYYNHGYTYNTDYHRVLIAKLKAEAITAWNTRKADKKLEDANIKIKRLRTEKYMLLRALKATDEDLWLEKSIPHIDNPLYMELQKKSQVQPESDRDLNEFPY